MSGFRSIGVDGFKEPIAIAEAPVLKFQHRLVRVEEIAIDAAPAFVRSQFLHVLRDVFYSVKKVSVGSHKNTLDSCGFGGFHVARAVSKKERFLEIDIKPCCRFF